MTTRVDMAMARELGYMLAVTARWRRDIDKPVIIDMPEPRYGDLWFRARPRIIRSLDTKSRARGNAVIRFADRRGRRWTPTPGRVFRSKDDNRDVNSGQHNCFLVQQHVFSIQGDDIVESCHNSNTSIPSFPAERVHTPGLPDPVALTKRFVDRLGDKLTRVSPEMILCSDEILYIHDVSATGDRRRLQLLLHRFHGHHALLTWPSSWIFTVMDPIKSPRLQKASAAVIRDGHLCCDDDILSIGVVHDIDHDYDSAEHPVILLSVDGYVYMYDDGGINPTLYLLTKHGFSDFCRRGLRERCGAGLDVGSTPVDYNEEPLKSLLQSRASIDDLVKARDRLLGSEAVIFHSDEMWTFLRVTDLKENGYSEDDFNTWKVDSGHLRLEAVFTVKACVSGVWVDSPVLVSDTGTVFYVEPSSGRLRFLAADLYNFLVLGVMRFRSNSCFPRGTFTDPQRSTAKTGAVSRPVFCPRGQRCRRKIRMSLQRRIWQWFCNTWGSVTGCCRG
uniref:Tegument protein UL43 n=1 Tax=Mastomys natalensis cytomegalovirus 2 TaxID=2973540 RepID=A0A9Y1IKV8_9BETA|nr:tegument protein UL43 [Mastomys natalensis cytomegalovirus 2]WEG69187.1 tegument protein UL43 [Mastomys natalensis cytomegalovirus 2]WEG69326.1 tegument protein UL43 [Mastomys natalensis cytomegalovirus 2]WEG69464.1 tegument protein UL43 [Mastomys natalensis cytomegalovirus 2]WEG69602.1 tegument protein UL43 [Mastomys natalensis cytomegalovirus 2]